VTFIQVKVNNTLNLLKSHIRFNEYISYFYSRALFLNPIGKQYALPAFFAPEATINLLRMSRFCKKISIFAIQFSGRVPEEIK